MVSVLILGIVLALVQFLAALPWISVIVWGGERVRTAWESWRQSPFAIPYLVNMGSTLAGVLAAGLVLGFGLLYIESSYLQVSGQTYTAILQLQLILDFFIFFFAGFLNFWPKGAAVALAAFRESVRQPLYWLLGGGAFLLMLISTIVPYFTFGEDHLMVKDLGFDTIMLAAVVFGTLTAALSISEEIEGRTAVTLMSKPISRRQFLLGKFAGILLAALLLFGLLGTHFQFVQGLKHWLDRLDPVPTPRWVLNTLANFALAPQANTFLIGCGRWADHTIETLPGLILTFCQVMVLTALAVSLATRLPMVVNLGMILLIFMAAHLTPVLVAIGESIKRNNPGSPVAQIVAFMSGVFDTLLPALSFFRVGPAILTDDPLPVSQFLPYVLQVSFYGVLYTGIVLLFGLILFEDRDLA